MKRILPLYVEITITNLQYFHILGLLKISSKFQKLFLFLSIPCKQNFNSQQQMIVAQKKLPQIFTHVIWHNSNYKNFEFAKSGRQCCNTYLTSSRRESISPVVRRQCWIEVGRGGWASFDEDSPIKDTKGNHEEIPAILNRLILTNVRATLYSFLAFLNNGDSL